MSFGKATRFEKEKGKPALPWWRSSYYNLLKCLATIMFFVLWNFFLLLYGFVCASVFGPPPTAYAPKLLDSGGVVSFTKGERFRENNPNNGDPPVSILIIVSLIPLQVTDGLFLLLFCQLTRSQSQSSVGSTGSGISRSVSKLTNIWFLQQSIIIFSIAIVGKKAWSFKM